MSTEDRDEILVEAVVKVVRPMVKALVSTARAHFLQEAREQVEGERMTCCNGIGGHKTGCPYFEDDSDEALEAGDFDWSSFKDSEGKAPGQRTSEAVSAAMAENQPAHYDPGPEADSGWEAKYRQADDLLSRTRDERDDAVERAEKAEAEVDKAHERADAVGVLNLRLARERDEAERQRIVGDKLIRQLVGRAENAEADKETWKGRYTDLFDRIRSKQNFYYEHAALLTPPDGFMDLLPEDEQ